jgi:hypothetical protein
VLLVVFEPVPDGVPAVVDVLAGLVVVDVAAAVGFCVLWCVAVVLVLTMVGCCVVCSAKTPPAIMSTLAIEILIRRTLESFWKYCIVIIVNIILTFK